MTVIGTSGNNVDVYQFETYCGNTDQMMKSRRYATKAAIESIAKGGILFASKISVDRSDVESPSTDIPGMTAIGYMPQTTGGFQRFIKD